MEIVSLKPETLDPQVNLAGKTYLITGAAAGIGRALALHLSQLGAETILLDKSLKDLEALYDEIVANKKPEPALHPINLTKMTPDDAETIKESVEKLFGKLDGLIHNAAITGPICPIGNLPPDKWQEIIHLNLNVPYLLTKTLLPLLCQTPHSSILFTTANEAFTPKAYWGPYAASKAAILQLAATLHEEMENNTTLRVNAINPIMARTGLRLKAYPGLDPNRFPLPETLVSYYSYLLSDSAKSIRGKHCQLPVVAIKDGVINQAQQAQALDS